jgi:hypothetical protein
MHETFVYSTTGSVLQVEFWQAYNRYFDTPDAVHPRLNASDVIKNVTVAFPGTGARVEMDETGQGKRFVIGGLGYRVVQRECGSWGSFIALAVSVQEADQWPV